MATEEDAEEFLTLVSIEEKSQIPEPLARKLQDVWSAKVKEVRTIKVEAEKQKLCAEQEIFQLEKQLICIQGQLEEEASGRRDYKKQKETIEEKLTEINSELQHTKTSVITLTRELQHVQSEKETVSSESVTMAGNLETRNVQVAQLQEQINRLNEQLCEATRSKNEAFINSEEAISRERQLKYREKRLEQEQALLTRQITVLQQHLEQRSEETLTQRTTSSSTILSLQTDLNHKIEELRLEREETEQLRRQVKEKGERIQQILETLNASRESEVKLEETFRQELQAQQKLTEIYKGSAENEKERAGELERAVEELRRLLNEASAEYGALERAKAKTDQDNADALLQSNTLVNELKDELDKVNQLLQASAKKNISGIEELSPAASAASQLVSKGLSLTQLYAEYITVSEKLIATQDENKRLKRYVDQILQEIEERVPVIKKQREDHQRSLETITSLQTQLQETIEDREKQRVECEESVRRSQFLERENQRLEVQVKDVSRQVAVLVTQVEAARAGLPPPPIPKDALKRPSVAGDVISEHLVAFRDASELQEQNNKLRSSLRELSAQLEDSEKTAITEKTKQLQAELEMAHNQLKELNESRERQESLTTNLIQQRDMYRALLTQQSPGNTNDSNKAVAGNDKNPTQTQDAGMIKKLEVGLEKSKEELSTLKKEHEEYRSEKAKNDRMLQEEHKALKSTMEKTRNENIKLLSQAEYNDERIKTLQTNADTLHRQLASVEKNNATLQGIVGRHEGTIDTLRNEYITLQKKLSKAQVALDNLREERTLLKESEARLLAERESLSRGQTSQAMVLANLETIKINLERKDSGDRTRHQNQLDDLNQQLAMMKAKLESNEDLKMAREKIQELEFCIETLQSENTSSTKQLHDTQTELTNINKKVQELQEKINTMNTGRAAAAAAVPASRVRDLETQLAEEKHKVSAGQVSLEQTQRSLTQLLQLNKKHEKQLEDSSEACKTVTQQFTKLQKEAEETEAERRKLEDQLREALEETDTLKNLLTSKINKVEDELHAKQQELREVNESLTKAKEDQQAAREQAKAKINEAQEAQDKYEREVMLHGADLKALATLKERQAQFNTQLQDATASAQRAEQVIRDTRLGFEQRENVLRVENNELVARCNELEQSNQSLLNQFTQLSDKMAAIQAKFTSSEGEGSQPQFTEDEARSSDQLREVIRFLRRERDVASGKCGVAQAECSRLEAQRDGLKEQLDHQTKDLAQEREKNQVGAETAGRCAELLRKVQTMDALTDSNRLMREEKEGLQSTCQEYQAKYQALQKQIEPLQEKLRINTNIIEALVLERKSLENEKQLFKKRTQELVEKLNQAKPEDFVKLQQEVTEQQKTLQSREFEITRLKNQLAQLSKNQQMIINQRNQYQQQLSTCREDLRRTQEELKNTVMDKTRTIQQHIDESKKVLTEKSRLQQQLVGMQERVRGLEASSQQSQATHQQEMANYVDENKKISAEKIRLQQQINELKQGEEALKTQIEATKKETEKLNSKLKETEGKLNEAIRKADNFEKQSSQLRKIATKYKKAAEGGTAGGASGGEGGDGVTSVASSAEKVKELEDTLALMHKRLDTAQDEVTRLQQEVATLKLNLANKETENNMIKTQIMKERLSILACANTDGTQRLKPVIMRKSKKPRALKDIMNSLPVEYHGTPSDWFNHYIMTEWYHSSFDLAISKHQARNTWCKLLKNNKTPALGCDEFEGFPMLETVTMLAQAGQDKLKEEEKLVEWVEEDLGVPGYYHMTDEEIAQDIQCGEVENKEDEEESAAPGPSLATGMDAGDSHLSLLDKTGAPIAQHYEAVRMLRMQILQLKQARQVQPKISSFLKPVSSPLSKRQRALSELSTVFTSSLSSVPSTSLVDFICSPSLYIDTSSNSRTSSLTTTPSTEELSLAISRVTREKDAELSKLESELESKTQELERRTQELTVAKNTTAQLKHNVNKHTAQLTKRLEEMQSKKAEYEGRITQLEREKEQLTHEMDSLNKKLHMQQRQLENIQKHTAGVNKTPASAASDKRDSFEPPPTANIKPMSAPGGVSGAASPRCQAATQVVPPSRAIPTASIRPMAPPLGPGATSQGSSTVVVVPPLETHSDGLVSSTVTLPQATVTPTPATPTPTTVTPTPATPTPTPATPTPSPATPTPTTPTPATPTPATPTPATPTPTTHTPAISTPTPTTLTLAISTPAISTPAISTPTPAISTPTPAISTPTPAISTPTPTISTPTPAISTPTPAISTPTPAISTPTPAISTPTPAISTPTPASTLTATVSPTPTSVSLTTSNATPSLHSTSATPPSLSSITTSQPTTTQQQQPPPTTTTTTTAPANTTATQQTTTSKQSTVLQTAAATSSSIATTQQQLQAHQSASTNTTTTTTTTTTTSQQQQQGTPASSTSTAIGNNNKGTTTTTTTPPQSSRVAMVVDSGIHEVCTADALVSQAIALVSPLSSQQDHQTTTPASTSGSGPGRAHKRPLDSSEAVTNTGQVSKRCRPEHDPNLSQEPGPSSSHSDQQQNNNNNDDDDDDDDDDEVILLDSDDDQEYHDQHNVDDDEDDDEDIQAVDSDDDEDDDDDEEDEEGMEHDDSTHEMEAEEGEAEEDDDEEEEEDMGNAEAEAEEAEAEATPQVPNSGVGESQPQPSPGTSSQPSSSSTTTTTTSSTTTTTTTRLMTVPRPNPRQDHRTACGRQQQQQQQQRQQALPPFTQLPQYEEAGGDDSIVPSTPTLFPPRRGDPFPDPGASPHVPSTGFVFRSSPDLSNPPHTSGLAQMAEGGLIDDTRMDLAQLDDNTHSHPSTPLPRSPSGEAGAEEGGGVSTSEGEAGHRDPPPPAILVTGAAEESGGAGGVAAAGGSGVGGGGEIFTEADSVAAEVGEDHATPHSQVIDFDDDDDDEGGDEGERESGEAEERGGGEAEESRGGGEAEESRGGGEAEEKRRDQGSLSSQGVQEVSSPTTQPPSSSPLHHPHPAPQPAPQPSSSTSLQQQQQQRRITPITWNDSPRHQRGRGFPAGRSNSSTGGRGFIRAPGGLMGRGGGGFNPQLPRGSSSSGRARRSRPGPFSRGGGPPM
ncbi:hypothetical protein Pcinc_008498 [Petrolisthes cinctipes]|uniref:Nucleoprotein TPR n=1 Tax=Petrolisthes cinctipes TaxID=88211 RepID=A0AAE1G8Q7_PETCI|nr:hypothetical protein Pcinc_008498 [Petrolisthes cinctipes]